MRLEQKDLSPNEIILYLSKPFPFIGTFYQKEHLILQNLLSYGLAKEVLLTADFLYLQTTSNITLPEAKLQAIAELDDYEHYISSKQEEETAPMGNIINKINLIIKLVVAPLLQKDGGDIKLESYANNTTYVRFLGKCDGCPYAKHTLKNHVEKKLIRYLPQIKEVILI